MVRDPYRGLRDHQQYLSRVVRCQIADVTEDIGKCQIDVIDFPGSRAVTTPVLWFSAVGRQSAWGRYMPMGTEMVDVEFRNDGTATIIGYNANASPDRSAGWPTIKKLQEDGVSGFATFKPLKRGEFDFKSCGDAYIFGSSGGTLLLAGGQATIKLDRQAYRAEVKASETHLIGSGGTSELRIGTVFRKSKQADAVEVAQPTDGQLTRQEFLADVNQPLPTGTKSIVSKAKIHFGDLYTEANEPITNSDSGAKLRGQILIGDEANAQNVFTLEIDNLGNIVWNQASTGSAVGLKMTMQRWNISVSQDTVIKSSVSMDLEAPTFTVKGDLLRFGSASSSEPMVCGTLLNAALTNLINTVFVSNAPTFCVGNTGVLNPTVVTALQTWLQAYVTANYYNSTKAFTEQ